VVHIIEKLARARRRAWTRRVPIIRQAGLSDCGPACLAMTLRYFRKQVSFEEVKQLVAPSQRGSSLLTLAQAAEYYNLVATPVRLLVAELHQAPQGSILHWDDSHYVVLDRCSRRSIVVVDPAIGRRRLSRKEAARHLSGHALVMEIGDHFEVTAEPSRRIARFITQARSGISPLAGLILLSLLMPVFALAGPYLTNVVVDRVIPTRNYSLLVVTLFGLCGFVLFQAASAFVRSRLMLQLRSLIDTRVTQQFVEHLLSLSVPFFQRHSTGDLLARIYSNSSVRGLITSLVLSGLLDVAMVIIYVGILAVRSAPLAVVVGLLASAQIALLFFSRRRRASFAAENLRVQANNQTFDIEMLLAMETVKAMGAEDDLGLRWRRQYTSMRELLVKQGRFESWHDALQVAARMSSPMILLSIGASHVMVGDMTLGEMLALNVIAGGLLGPLTGLAGILASSQNVGRQLERLEDVLATPHETIHYGNQRPALNGEITLRKVSFRYSPLLPWVFRDVDLAIRAGSTVVITGTTGCGKSTLARLMLGLYLPTDGSIDIDGHVLRSLDVGWFRRQLGVMTQAPQLFTDTVAYNISLNRPGIVRDDVVWAARTAGIDEFVLSLPHGYETVLTGRGAALSGGQHQRLALARALVSRPKILLLDEATSQLDATTEYSIWSKVTALGCTVIAISHRPNLFERADMVVLLESGRILDSGAPHELVRRSLRYREIVRPRVSRSADANAAMAAKGMPR